MDLRKVCGLFKKYNKQIASMKPVPTTYGLKFRLITLFDFTPGISTSEAFVQIPQGNRVL